MLEFHFAKQRAHHVDWVLVLLQIGHVQTIVGVVGPLALWWFFKSVLALKTLMSVRALERRARSRRWAALSLVVVVVVVVRVARVDGLLRAPRTRA